MSYNRGSFKTPTWYLTIKANVVIKPYLLNEILKKKLKITAVNANLIKKWTVVSIAG